MSSPSHSKGMHVFVDFDGTITSKDTGTHLIDACMGRAQRKALDDAIVAGTRSFRDAVGEMWRTVKIPWAEAVERLAGIDIDPGFAEIVARCEAQQIPVTILSSGLVEVIEHFLGPHGLGEPRVHVRANTLERAGADGWHVTWVDDTPRGHDKAKSIDLRLAACGQDRGSCQVVFIGDGISDIGAAQVSDRVFAKRGDRLATVLADQGAAFEAFDGIADVAKALFPV